MRKTQIQNSVSRVAISTVDVGREKLKEKVGAHAMISAVLDDSLSPFWSRHKFVSILFEMEF